MEPSDIKYHLWSNKYDMWWRRDGRGYTNNRDEAGLYSLDDAVEYVVRSADCGILAQVTCMVAAPVNWTKS